MRFVRRPKAVGQDRRPKASVGTGRLGSRRVDPIKRLVMRFVLQPKAAGRGQRLKAIAERRAARDLQAKPGVGRIKHPATRFAQRPIGALRVAIDLLASRRVGRTKRPATRSAPQPIEARRVAIGLPASRRVGHTKRPAMRFVQREATIPGALPAIEARVRQAVTPNAVRSNREAKTHEVLLAIVVRARLSAMIGVRAHQPAATDVPLPRAATTRKDLPATAFRALRSARIPHRDASETTRTTAARAASVQPATPNAANSTHLARAIQARRATTVVRAHRTGRAMTANARRPPARSKNAAPRNDLATTARPPRNPSTKRRRNPRNPATTTHPHPPASPAREKKASFACRRSCPNSVFARVGKPMNGSKKAGSSSTAR
jgi:hypothetical protein